MSDDWFKQKLAPDGDTTDGCHPDEAEALKDYLHQKTTPTEAAQAITQPVLTSTNPKEDVVRLWSLLMGALMELPSQHIKPTIALLQAIEDLPAPEFAVEKSKQPNKSLWKALPGFGHLWSDMYKCRHCKGLWTTGSLDVDELRDRQVRIAEAEARLFAADLGDIPIDWGYETIVDALESSSALLEVEVPAAAQWFVVCSGRFRVAAQNKEKSRNLLPPETMNGISLRDLWRVVDDDVMTLERWSFWGERLIALCAESGVVRDAAGSALVAMGEAGNVVISRA